MMDITRWRGKFQFGAGLYPGSKTANWGYGGRSREKKKEGTIYRAPTGESGNHQRFRVFPANGEELTEEHRLKSVPLTAQGARDGRGIAVNAFLS